MLFESCVESAEAARASERGGAGRIELCADLEVGGTTPAPALIAECVSALSIPVFVMIRPRGGTFVYDTAEVEAMLADIEAARAAGAHGLVFGALRADRTIDADLMTRLIRASRPLPVTCHRAFDDTRDVREALDALLALGVDRVLTSGGSPTASEGAHAIAGLVAHAGSSLVVMAGGGVRAENVARLLARTGIHEVHAHICHGLADEGRVREFVAELSEPRNPGTL